MRAGLAAALAMLMLWAGCATVAPDPEADRRLAYRTRLQERLSVAQETDRHTLRFNPTPCRCPPFEMLLDHRWVRVDLAVTDVDDPVLAALLEATRGERRDEALRTYRVEGALEDALAVCGGGALYATLRPTAFVPAEASPGALGDPLPSSAGP